MSFSLFRLIPQFGLLAMVGCAAYAVPGHGADFHQLGMSAAERDQQTDYSVGAVLDKKPLASFPATIAVVRIEGSDYTDRTVQTYGSGKYRVVLTHDVEKPEWFVRIAKLPMIAGLEPINRLELPEVLNTDREVRTAAAAVHADMVLIYTFDDSFDDRDMAKVLTVFTLGVWPSKYLNVNCTASAVLMDTRNGYIYGAAESATKQGTIANCWGEDAAAEAVRKQVEGAAFESLGGEFEKTWAMVTKQYAHVDEKPKQ